MFFIILVFLTAFMLEGIGTYISIIGLSQVFTQSVIILGLMAILDLAKIVTVSFLYKYWQTAHWVMKSYMLVAVLVLMTITSTGAFSYLSGQFQHAIEGTQQNTIQVDSLVEEKDRLQKRKDAIDNQIANLPSNYVKSRISLQNQFTEEVTRINNRLVAIDDELPKLKSTALHTKVEVGPILYIAEAFKTTPEEAIKWIILTIIFVFDPLAIALILAGNFLLKNRTPDKESINKSSINKETLEQAFKNYKPDTSFEIPTEKVVVKNQSDSSLNGVYTVPKGSFDTHTSGSDLSGYTISGLKEPDETPITKSQIDNLIVTADENGKLPVIEMEYILSFKEPELQNQIDAVTEIINKKSNYSVGTVNHIEKDLMDHINTDIDTGRAMAFDDITDSLDHVHPISYGKESAMDDAMDELDHITHTTLGGAMAGDWDDFAVRDIITLDDINKRPPVRSSLEDYREGDVTIRIPAPPEAKYFGISAAYNDNYIQPTLPAR